jgi:predicted transcriptional regulator
MVISIRLSRTQEQRVRRLAKQLATTRSALIRAALETFDPARDAAARPSPYATVARWLGCARSGRGDLAQHAHQLVRSAIHARVRAR